MWAQCHRVEETLPNYKVSYLPTNVAYTIKMLWNNYHCEMLEERRIKILQKIIKWGKQFSFKGSKDQDF